MADPLNNQEEDHPPKEDWRENGVLSEWRVGPMARPNALSAQLQAGRLIRLNVQTATSKPFRQRFSFEEAGNGWRAYSYVYVYAEATTNTRRYVLERAEEPHRSRVRWEGAKKPQSRDSTVWKAPWGEFHAYPERVGGAVEFNVDWTSSPDRYAIERTERPRTAWLRCFRFFAFPATKYHLMVRAWPQGSPVATSYALVAGHECPVRAPWRCAFAFYALEAPAPCANKYYVQRTKPDEPYARIRIGMTPSDREDWAPDPVVIYASDVGLPDTSKINVQYKIRDGTDAEVEQNRFSLDDNAGGLWVDKFAMYVYPAPTVRLSNDPDDDRLPPEAASDHQQYYGDHQQYYGDHHQYYDPSAYQADGNATYYESGAEEYPGYYYDHQLQEWRQSSEDQGGRAQEWSDDDYNNYYYGHQGHHQQS